MGGAEVRAVVDRLRALEQRRMDLWAGRDRLHATLRRTAPSARDLADLEAGILACLADRREMCREHPAEARRLLDSVLTARIALTPHGAGPTGYYTFTAMCALDRLGPGSSRADRTGHPSGTQNG